MKEGFYDEKIISLGVTLAILMSFSACKIRENGIENANNVTNNDVTNNDATNQLGQADMQDTNNNVNQGATNLSGVTDANNNAGNYQDGTYTGFGDGNAEGVERAIVLIRNGRIADIDLATIDQQESTNTQNPEDNDENGTNNGNGSGASPGVDTNNIAGAGAGANNAAGTNNTTGMGTGTDAGNTIRDAIDGVKTSLIGAIIQNQNVNAYTNANNTYVVEKISNWRLAVARALDQARR